VRGEKKVEKKERLIEFLRTVSPLIASRYGAEQFNKMQVTGKLLLEEGATTIWATVRSVWGSPQTPGHANRS